MHKFNLQSCLHRGEFIRHLSHSNNSNNSNSSSSSSSSKQQQQQQQQEEEEGPAAAAPPAAAAAAILPAPPPAAAAAAAGFGCSCILSWCVGFLSDAMGSPTAAAAAAAAGDEELAAVAAAQLRRYKSSEQPLCFGALTLSGISPSHLHALMHIDDIKAQSRPLKAPEPLAEAPFFLPSRFEEEAKTQLLERAEDTPQEGGRSADGFKSRLLIYCVSSSLKLSAGKTLTLFKPYSLSFSRLMPNGFLGSLLDLLLMSCSANFLAACKKTGKTLNSNSTG
ncbi:hypothetical protein Emag_006488 [Eimeria magna]